MEHKIINTGSYLLIVDESEIKEGDWCIDIYKLKNNHNPIFKWSDKFKVDAKKIIAHLPLNNSPILEGVDLLPPLEDEVEKLAESMLPKEGTAYIAYRKWVKMGIIAGYNKAKEKYKYTEEDIRKAIDMATNGKKKVKDEKGIEFLFGLYEDEIIQFLQQPKMPIGFECETNILSEIPTDIRSHIYDKTYEVPKTTTNEQYQTLWVGEYVYEN
jgi:hypothetical protein